MNKRHLTEVEQFYQLLPAIYRLRDAEQGYPLRAFLAILAEQGQIVEADMARLYANWFIESCEEWVVPYIGDLLGVRGLRPAGEAGWSQRALVANTLRYRRRKGTPALLEQIVYDVTGWAAHAVELYERVGTTQYLDHLRAGSGGTANLKQLNDPHLIGSAFDPLAYTPDVRLMAGTRQSPVLAARLNSGLGQRVVSVGQARPNLSAIGLYIWRLKPYQLERVTAYDHHDGKRFRFNPLGSDTQLFHKPAETPTFSRVAQEHELPVALRTAPLAAELCAYRQAQKDGRETNARFLKAPLPFAIYVGHHQPVALEDLWICDLSQWDNKQALTQLLKQAANQPTTKGDLPAAQPILVDPEHGRIFVADGDTTEVSVSYNAIFTSDIGGGPYQQQESVDRAVDTGIQHIISDENHSLAEAWQTWTTATPAQAIIEIVDNATHVMPEQLSFQPPRREQPITLNGSQLTIQAANGKRPVFVGDLVITGTEASATLTLRGLLIAGQIRLSGTLGRITIQDCTLVPGIRLSSQGVARAVQAPSILGVELGESVEVFIERSMVGPICLPSTITRLTIVDSVIDAPEPKSLIMRHKPPLLTMPERLAMSQVNTHSTLGNAFIIRPILLTGQLPALAGNQSGDQAGPLTQMARTTIFGHVHLKELIGAENVLFTAPVMVDRTITGALQNCYVPPNSKTPRQVNCLPDMDDSELLPAFTARRYGQPGYAQLSLACPTAIRTGGTGGAEIGVFHNLRQPQREAALLAQLEEYLRLGLEAGIVYVT